MKRIFLDTNVLIDFLDLNRKNHLDAKGLIIASENTGLKIVISTLSYLNTHYVLTNRFKIPNKVVLEQFRKIRTISELSDFSQTAFDKALILGWSDFEDATQFLSAKESKCDAIITSDRKGFAGSDIPVYSASEYLKMSSQ